MRAFAPVGDISKFKRYFHCILNAECYARLFHRRNWPSCTQDTTIYSILTKIKRAYAPDGYISTFKRYFIAFYVPNVVHVVVSPETSTAARKS